MTIDIVPILDTLAAQAHPDGGWGYVVDQPAQLEPTCLALLALSQERERFERVIDQGWQALRRQRGADGAYRLPNGREEAIWPTALALFVQSVLGFASEDGQATAARLLGVRGRATGDDPETAETLDIDCQLIGWPWSDGNFSWVEPTAWAVLALRRAGHGNEPRVDEGRRLLVDRALDDGGINYGSRRVFGRLTEPIPTPTALMLLALQGLGEHPRVAAALAYLRGQVLADNDLEHLCWIRLALDVWPADPPLLGRLDEFIAQAHGERSEVTWVKPAPLREALTALALGTQNGNPFRLNGMDPSRDTLTVPAVDAPRRRWTDRIKSAFRGVAVEAIGRLRPVPPRTAVHIASQHDYRGDLAETLKRQYEAFRAQVPLSGKRVVLKPNLVEYHRDKVINTNPHVIAAAIELCKREGASEVIVAEGPGHWRNAEYLVQASGLGDVLRHYQVPFVDLNHDEPVRVPNLGRLTKLEYLYQARTVATAEVLISLPKLKTHHWVGATLSLKNLFGTLPGICYGWPKNELHWRGIEFSIVDIALTRTPDLAIVDGIIGMEGDGPLNGTARPVGALIMGADPLAVDATCCRLMQLNPEQVDYLAIGYRKRLGLLREAEIEQIGERIDALAQPFETLEHFHRLYLGRPA